MIEFFFVNFTHAFTLFGRYLVLIACFSARGYTDDNRMAYGFLTGFFLSLSIRKFLYINFFNNCGTLIVSKLKICTVITGFQSYVCRLGLFISIQTAFHLIY